MNEETLAKLAEMIADALVERHGKRDGEGSLVGRERMAEIAGISVPSLDRLVRDGRIPSIQINSRRLFEPKAVIDALKQKN